MKNIKIYNYNTFEFLDRLYKKYRGLVSDTRSGEVFYIYDYSTLGHLVASLKSQGNFGKELLIGYKDLNKNFRFYKGPKFCIES